MELIMYVIVILLSLTVGALATATYYDRLERREEAAYRASFLNRRKTDL